MKRIKPGAAECGALGSILKLDLRQEECCPWATSKIIIIEVILKLKLKGENKMNKKQKQEASAARIIKNWKENPEIREQYGNDFGRYALETEINEEWQDPKVRHEFEDDYESFVSFKLNSHRITIIGKKEATGKGGAGVANIPKGDSLEPRERYYGDCEELMEEIKAEWESNKALQDEFDGDFEAFLAYRLNNPRQRVGD